MSKTWLTFRYRKKLSSDREVSRVKIRPSSVTKFNTVTRVVVTLAVTPILLRVFKTRSLTKSR